ncbi:MAG: 5'-nucleotidase C-terminal domain-containing protein [candidate division KSB1 bacterium]|nr:5'-nucleotidase C-terminal domain-containing protein [candidate division KSB1 bacterium]
MRRSFQSLVLTLLGSFLLFSTAFSQPDTLTIIHVNDTHSNLLPYGAGQYGGIARAASVIGLWKQTAPNPILVHAGDLMVGTLMFNAYFGVPELQILNSLGFDALCLGNHEFDAGSEDLGNILASAQLDSSFDIICSNAVNLSAVPTLGSIVRSHAIEQRGKVKVGLLGLTTPNANVESSPAPVFIDTSLVQVAMQKVVELKGLGCQVIVLLSHLGLALDMQLAQYFSGVDVIIGGHSHTVLSSVVYINNIPIVQAGEFYHYVGKLRLIYDGAKTAVLDYTLQEITPAIPAEPTTEAIVEQLRLGIVQKYTPVIGDPYQPISYTSQLLSDSPTSGNLDTPMGNLITTAMLNNRYVGNADCALEPTGHIVEKLYPGPVAAADLFRAYPYGYDARDGLGFRLASFDLSGAQIYGILQALLAFIVPDIGYYDYLMQSSGLDFVINKTPQGLQLNSVLIAGKPVHPDSSYTIVTSDRVVGYLQTLFGISPANLTIHPVSVFQVAKEYVAGIDTLKFSSTGHNLITGVKGKPESGVVRDFELGQNYPNPFNPDTNIFFRLDRSNEATLVIYDLLGREIRTLINGHLPAGEYSLQWDGKDNRGNHVPSGLYFYRLTAGGKQALRKMLLLR